MWIFAALVTMLCFGLNNLIFKWSTGKGYSKVHIQFYFYLVAFVLTLIYGFFTGIQHINVVTAVIGGLIGVLNTVGNIQMSKAFEKGPASLTSPLISANSVIPILSAALIFNEHITMIQWIGILIMMASAIVIQYTPGTNGNTEYVPWLLRIMFAIVSFGILGILMKTSSYLHIDSLNTLICMYGGGWLYLAITSLIQKEEWKQSEAKTGGIVGLFSIIGYSAYFFALNTGTASIVFPIVSLSCLVVVLGGCWVFKERLKAYQVIGVITALLGIVFTKI
ncbi:drug/metabolite transporter (DMT)-like permease [Lysinibacillus composti]|uniref:DMT family transporter n=1 Tax=Lysinibacillus composti TaxID=720633 RepID=A0A3N9UHZ8_9BACI|nr:GRP family sugar transporter [Lysinibacillus composti]MBM7607776.1 drug/metabolite transporter (DMT)-like permease [Lysinibacillus composti]RQW75733.1 DMT family transporter [Lysinibacillus composti]